MHDMSLGGPVNVGVQPGANHDGSCFDGVYGCHLCWNSENNYQGKMSECEWCHKQDFTRVTKALDEPVTYALCKTCRLKMEKVASEEYEDYLVECSITGGEGY